jgi:phage-related protein
MPRTVEFYRTGEGRCPIEEFLTNLDTKEAQKVLWVFRLIERVERVPAIYFKKLVGTDIWECRISVHRGIYRAFGFFILDDRLVLTHAYLKKSRKTDPREIQRANRYRDNYMEREGKR